MASLHSSSRTCRIDLATDIDSQSQFQGWDDGGESKRALEVKVLGVCCGNSLNEIEHALVHYTQSAPNASLHMELLQYSVVEIPSTVRSPILDLLHDIRRNPPAIQQLYRLLGEMFSFGIKSHCKRYNIEPTSIDLVGIHAPNLPLGRSDKARTFSSDWNDIVTMETGITACFDFSTIECAVGGPPVTPVAFIDTLILRHPTKFRACLNISEITNITFIPPLVDDGSRPIISRDCGPGSLLIDYVVRYNTSNNEGEDYNGKLGSKGRVNQVVVDRFLGAHDYLHRSPPLSMAREMFGAHEAQLLIDECISLEMSEADTLATITRATAQNIINQYLRLSRLYFMPSQNVDELFICGPSARNLNIIDHIESEIPEHIITKPLDDIGLFGDANETACYAHLALETVLGHVTQPVSTSSSTTSVQSDHDTIRGKIIAGAKWGLLAERIQQFSRGKPLRMTKDVRVAGSFETTVKAFGLRSQNPKV